MSAVVLFGVLSATVLAHGQADHRYRSKTDWTLSDQWLYEHQFQPPPCPTPIVGATGGHRPTDADMARGRPSWTNVTTASSSLPTPLPWPEVNSTNPDGNKRGISYNQASDLAFTEDRFSWAYNWKSQPDATLATTLEYVPMCWGPGSQNVCSWEIQSAVASGSRHFLSFNEPDHPAQANMTPKEAADLHVEIFNELPPSAKIGSPAVTNGPPPMGIAWLEQFLRLCRARCRIDFVAYHWYNTADNIESLKKHSQAIIDLANVYDIGAVWLTEFGTSTGTAPEQARFLQEAMDFLDYQPAIERYAYFMLRDGILLAGEKLSPLGLVYAGIG